MAECILLNEKIKQLKYGGDQRRVVPNVTEGLVLVVRGAGHNRHACLAETRFHGLVAAVLE